MEQTQKYPIGIQTFSEIIENGYVYVDKTEFIHRLVSQGKYYFLARPRRFGKSLLVSTIKAFFEGRRELFRGLAIDGYDHDWAAHPVFYLNFVGLDAASEDGLNELLESHLSGWEAIYGREEHVKGFSMRLYGVIKRAVEQTGQKAVLLVDEYDKALVSTLDKPELNVRFRDILKPVFSNFKGADEYLCFGLLTGVSRFSRLSIFSDLNNLRDISMNSQTDTICGITADEITRYLMPGVEGLAATTGCNIQQTLALLKENYDGYHFTASCPDIYNPFSLLSALQDCKISDYWFATGTPSFLLKTIATSDCDIRKVFNVHAREASLCESDTYSRDPVPMLFQTGYLTIKEADRVTGFLRLGIPNGEVRRGLFNGLLPLCTGTTVRESESFIFELIGALNAGDPERAMNILRAFFADIPYYLTNNKPEIYYENNLYIIFKILGLLVRTEYATSRGRIDVVVETAHNVYVMELKLNGSAEAALEQIDARDYLLPFTAGGKTLYKIGVNFDTAARNITDWQIRRG